MRVFPVPIGWLAAAFLAAAAGAAEFEIGNVDYGNAPLAAAPQPAPTGSPWWTWQAGAEATYLSLNARALEPGSLSFGFEAAPRIWLGVENASGFGAQVRYWQFDADARAVEQFGSAIGMIASKVELCTLDAEALRAWRGDSGGLTLTFGGRYAAFENDNVLGANDVGGSIFPPQFSEILDREFHGGGLTGSVQLTRALGEAGWQLFGNVRGSALWGNETLGEQIVFVNNGSLTNFTFQERIDNARLYIVEAQIGLQWSQYLECCRGAVFARTTFEYQNWDTTAVGDNGGPSRLDSDLYGVAFAIGLQR